MISKSKIAIMICTVLTIIGLNASDANSVISENITIVEQLLSESQLMVASFDDWGLNGALSQYGLPEYNSLTKYNDFPMNDPLYGTLPISWLNSRMQKIEINPATAQISLSPFYADSGMNLSRFDYYRGDYGFINFAALLSGAMSEDIKWRFFGEKLAYSGGYGLLGPSYLRTGGNPIQNYFLDLRKTKKSWLLETGSSHQKFISGLTDYSVLGVFDNETYLNWIHAGRLNEQRTGFYLAGTHSDSSGMFKTGLQITNFLYNVAHDSSLYSFSAEAFQYSGLIIKDFYWGAGSVFSLQETPIIESVHIRNNQQKQRIQFQQSVSISNSNSRLRYRLKLGSVNLTPIAEISGNYRLSKHFNVSLRSALDFITYPLSFYTDIGGNSDDVPENDGFSAFQQRLALDFRCKAGNINTQLDYTNASYLFPYKNKINSNNYSLQTEKLNRLFLTEEFNFGFPFQVKLKGRIIVSPPENNNAEMFLQSWSRIYKDAWLFHNNLNLYLTGDIYYLSDSKSIVWFEQLHTRATTDFSYYTNERLSFGGTIGAYIGQFHIFYTVYNAQGRAFSALPGTPFRNRLKIFGIDWTFTN